MASKKNLKKYIGYIADELMLEVYVISEMIPDIDVEKAGTLMMKVMQVKEEFLSRIGHCGGKAPDVVKKYYTSLKTDFHKAVDEILEEINNMHTQEEKK